MSQSDSDVHSGEEKEETGRKRKAYKLPITSEQPSASSSDDDDSIQSSDNGSLGSYVPRTVVNQKIYAAQGRELKRLKVLYDEEKRAAIAVAKEGKSWKTKFTAAERRVTAIKNSLENTQCKLNQEKTKNQCLSDQLESKKKASRLDMDTVRAQERLKLSKKIGDAEAEAVKQKGIAKDWKSKYDTVVKQMNQAKKEHEAAVKKLESAHKTESKRLLKNIDSLKKKIDVQQEAKQLHERKKMELEIQKMRIDLEKTKTVKSKTAEAKDREHRQKLEQIAARSTSSLLAYKEKTQHKKKTHQENIKAMTERIREASAGHEASDGRFPGPRNSHTISDAVQFLANQKKAQRLNSERIREAREAEEVEREWNNMRYQASAPPPPLLVPSVARRPPSAAAQQTTLTQLWTPENSSKRSRTTLESARSSFQRLYQNQQDEAAGLPPGWSAVWDQPTNSTVYANIHLGRIVKNLDDVFAAGNKRPEVMSSLSSSASARNASPDDSSPRPDAVMSRITPTPMAATAAANNTSFENPVELLSSSDEEGGGGDGRLEQAALAGKAIAEDEEELTVASENLLEDSQDIPSYEMIETQHSYGTQNAEEVESESEQDHVVETQGAVCDERDSVYE